MEIFWFQLTQVHLEKWPLKRNEKEKRVFMMIVFTAQANYSCEVV